MDALSRIILWGHVAGGAVALAVMLVPLISRKGGKTHRRAGQIYALAMLVAVASAWGSIGLRLLTGRYSGIGGLAFLGLVGLLALENLVYGMRVLKQKGRLAPHTHLGDRALSAMSALVGAGALVYGLYSGTILFIAFGALTAIMGVDHLREMARAPQSKRFWWYAHLGNMVGACIATLTAFLVFNFTTSLGGPAWMVWLAPTAVGVPAITLWTRHYKRRFGEA